MEQVRESEKGTRRAALDVTEPSSLGRKRKDSLREAIPGGNSIVHQGGLVCVCVGGGVLTF